MFTPALPLLLAVLLPASPPDRADLIRSAAAGSARIWDRAADPVKHNLTSREIFTAALNFCEARQNPERLARLFDLAWQLQDRDPASKTYGNFRWYWNHPTVDDANAVEFCMEAGTILWIRHRDTLPAAARDKLAKILALATEGCLRHKVATSYTNIALMNAANLILLGENLDRPDALRAGRQRLAEIYRYTLANGTHEYDSPTYYGVDIGVLSLLETFAREEHDRAIARALLKLFWTDVAANWLPSVQRLAGAHSRTYDYLHGLGELDLPLRVNGWLNDRAPIDPNTIYFLLGQWQPPASLRELSAKFPRLVEQSWGENPEQFRTHYVLADISLSTAAAYYGGWMDMPLTVDFAGDRDSVRGYYIPDGRNDPYGKIKVAAGAHQKAFHFGPFFAAAQRTTDATALVVYRDSDIRPDTTTLLTHFVLPKTVDAVWIGNRRVEFAPRLPLKPDEPLVLRKGAAAVGIRVPWSRNVTGQTAPAALIWDGNKFGAVRLTIDHGFQRPTGNAGAALWVRIGSGLTNEAAFTAWRNAFAAAKAEVTLDEKQISLHVTGADGPVSVTAHAPFTSTSSVQLDPAPKRVTLAIDGADVGRQILQAVETGK